MIRSVVVRSCGDLHGRVRIAFTQNMETKALMDIESLQKSTEGLFPETLGMRFLSASKDEIRAEMEVSRRLCTLAGRLHGGVIMAFADTLGAYGTALNLQGGVQAVPPCPVWPF